MPEPRRLFIALWPDAETRAQLYRYQQALRQVDPALKSARPIRRENLHLTLRFLGNVNADDSDRLISALASIDQPGFTLQLDRPGYFRKPRIAWLGSNARTLELLSLVDAINACIEPILPSPLQPPGFKPHVSLFRNARGITHDESGAVIRWPVSEFVLVESITRPPDVEYRVLNTWRLK